MASNTIEQALSVRLTSTSSSTAVNDEVGDRVYFRLAEQNATMPYLAYFVVSDPHDPFTYSQTDAGQARIQFSLVDDDRYNVLDVAHVVRDNLDQFSGSMDGVTIISLNCSGVITQPISEQDNVFQASFDALIRYVDP